MTDYKVKITPELDSGKLEKQLKNLTKDRTMKIKIDTSGLEKAARLADKLNTKLTSASGPKAPKLSDYSQTIKDINSLIDAQNRLQNAMAHSGNTSPPSIYGPSASNNRTIYPSQMQNNTIKNTSASSSIAQKGMNALSTLSAITAIGNGLPTLLNKANKNLATKATNLATNLD